MKDRHGKAPARSQTLLVQAALGGHREGVHSDKLRKVSGKGWHWLGAQRPDELGVMGRGQRSFKEAFSAALWWQDGPELGASPPFLNIMMQEEGLAAPWGTLLQDLSVLSPRAGIREPIRVPSLQVW